MSLFSTENLSIFSSVGGGPMARLVEKFVDAGTEAAVRHQFTPERWRQMMDSSRTARLVARVATLGLFPARSVVQACLGHQDLLIPTTNPFLLPPALVASRLLHRKAVVPLIYDLYPDALEASGALDRSSILSRALAELNQFTFKHADGVVFIGQRMAEHAIERYGEPRRWTVIETGADTSEFASCLQQPLEPDTEFEAWCQSKNAVASYIGNLGLMHDWRTLADAIVDWTRREGSRQLGFVIAASGPGAAKLEAACAHLCDEQIRFIEPLENRAWVRLLALTDISLVTLRPEAHRTCVPSKTFSAMAAKSALLAVAPCDSDLAELVRSQKCGVVVEPGDAAQVVDHLARWIERPAELASVRDRSYQALCAEYDMPRLAQKWLDFLEDCERPHFPTAGYHKLKRALDLAASSAGLAATAPILLAAAVGIHLTMGSPVLFRQKRPGAWEVPFELLKFRTMRHAKPGEEGPESDADRITRLGAFLRSTSIDELPTLWNVFKGEMSLVGPRPLLMRYLARYTTEQRRRHEAKSGVTGWAQVNGRNALSWEEKFEHDAWYVDHRSIILDLKILLATVGKVLGRQGISQDQHATMPEFMGTEA
jgi:lipopolysaccharide/colanic/teichoic acid biosynthesis glycosyltransferase